MRCAMARTGVLRACPGTLLKLVLLSACALLVACVSEPKSVTVTLQTRWQVRTGRAAVLSPASSR